MNNKAKRSPAMDVIRCIALFSVVLTHFFLNSDYFRYPFAGIRMYLIGCMHSVSIVCIPLFLMLSGYLMKNKTISKKYYSKLLYTIGIYLLASLACAIYSYIKSPEAFSLIGTIFGILNFSTANYSWYVEMYIGLFLLIPFLNLIYNGLSTQKQKLWLIATMIILTALPSVLNSYQLFNLDWWKLPSSNSNVDIIFPDWWVGIYPITYYFIGCYLSEFPIPIKPSTNFALTIATFLLYGIYNCYRSYGAPPIVSEWNTTESFFNLIQSVLLFNLLASLKYERIGSRTSKILAYISKLTLGAYLCSSIFDDLFYGILRNYEPDMPMRLNYLPIIVFAVYICSLALSAVLNWIYDILAKTCTSIFNKSKNQENIA